MDKKPVSPRKLAANRKNSKRSPGPKTVAGKAKSSQNSYKHGFFAQPAFPNEKSREVDGEAFQMYLDALRTYYSPVGFMENSLVEELAVLYLRQRRLLRFDQARQCAADGGWAFAQKSSMANILRYETTVTRRIEHLVERLETLQEQRLAEETELFEPDEENEAGTAGEPMPTQPKPPVSPISHLAAPDPPTSPTKEPPQPMEAFDHSSDVAPGYRRGWIENAQDAELVERLRWEGSLESLHNSSGDEDNLADFDDPEQIN